MRDEDSKPLDIVSHGNLLLQISQEEGSQQHTYRVDTTVLQQTSRYFEKLLSDRFSEGQQLSATLAKLRVDGHMNMAEVPVDLLPRVSIVNIGRAALSKTGSFRHLVADFLRAIHGLDLAVSSPPVANLANLAVVADRFDAVACLAKYVQKRKHLQIIDAKATRKASQAMTEERVRQKLLIGLLFDHPSWVARYSKHLIMRDSIQWRPEAEQDHTKALWWDLPNGVEDELIQRREYILDMINSLQAHFLKLYTSGERQCKLGYDTSLQCDSFQLGEMVRFFHKIDTVRLQGKIYDNVEPVYYLGDIDRLLASLRQCSNYQVNQHHAHCGLRSRLLPLLDSLQNQLSLDNGTADIGICADCWRSYRSEYAWTQAKRPVLWASPRSLGSTRSLPNSLLRNSHQDTSVCLSRHIAVRDAFMAVEKHWTASDML
ncbi:hypothetical protein ACN47E_006599 [Coniothyrium glycines]